MALEAPSGEVPRFRYAVKDNRCRNERDVREKHWHKENPADDGNAKSKCIATSEGKKTPAGDTNFLDFILTAIRTL